MSLIQRVSVSGIKDVKIDQLSTTADNLLQSIYVKNLATFKITKPITQIAFQALIDGFVNQRLEYKQGGLSNKKDYDTSHINLLNGVLSFVPYVDDIADGDEIILKLSTLPYTGTPNNAKELILAGTVAEGVKGTPGSLGKIVTTCGVFGKNVHFFAVVSQGTPLPEGTTISNHCQLSFPIGAIVPPLTINFDGKRIKTFSNLIPKTDYFITYFMSFGGVVSGLSIPGKQTCGN